MEERKNLNGGVRERAVAASESRGVVNAPSEAEVANLALKFARAILILTYHIHINIF